MGKVSKVVGGFGSRVERVVKDGLATAGIRAVTLTESVPETKLIRLIVMAAAFEKLSPSERQNLIWRILNQKFSQEEQLKISVVAALSEEDVGQRLLTELS